MSEHHVKASEMNEAEEVFDVIFPSGFGDFAMEVILKEDIHNLATAVTW
jgi:cobyric acid synthase